eukprot:1161874-Pelagomonas_calceolata.AAC.2
MQEQQQTKAHLWSGVHPSWFWASKCEPALSNNLITCCASSRSEPKHEGASRSIKKQGEMSSHGAQNPHLCAHAGLWHYAVRTKYRSEGQGAALRLVCMGGSRQAFLVENCNMGIQAASEVYD